MNWVNAGRAEARNCDNESVAAVARLRCGRYCSPILVGLKGDSLLCNHLCRSSMDSVGVRKLLCDLTVDEIEGHGRRSRSRRG